MELKILDPIGIKPGTHKQQQQQAQEALSAATAIMPLLAKKNHSVLRGAWQAARRQHWRRQHAAHSGGATVTGVST